MRVAYIHQHFRTPRMNGGLRSWIMARELVRRGHEVTMLTADATGAGEGGRWKVTREDGIEVHWAPIAYNNEMRFPQRMRAFLRFSASATARLRRMECDVVVATSTPLTVAIPGVLGARRHGVPFLFEVRDLWPDLPIEMGALRHPLLTSAARRLERWSYRNATTLVALSPGMREGILRGLRTRRPVSVVPNIADTDFFDVTGDRGLPPSPIATDPRLAGRPVLCYAGTFGLVNGLEYAVDLAAGLQQLGSRAAVVLVGAGARKEAVLERARRLGVLDRTLFLLDPIPKEGIPALLRDSAMTLSTVRDAPGLRDNSANKFFDSLAAGRPIALNHGGWLAELVEEHGVGLVLPPSSPDAAAVLLRGRLESPGWRVTAGARARRLAEERFSPAILAGRFADLVEGTREGVLPPGPAPALAPGTAA